MARNKNTKKFVSFTFVSFVLFVIAIIIGCTLLLIHYFEFNVLIIRFNQESSVGTKSFIGFNGFEPTNFAINFTEGFNSIYFNINKTIKNIEKYDEYKSSFKYGIIWNFNKNIDDNMNPKHAVLIIYITSNNSKHFNIAKNPLSDARYQYHKLENTLNYCYIHKYDLIFGTKSIFKYIVPNFNIKDNRERRLNEYMNTPHFQKVFFIKLLFNASYNYEWIFYIDFDTLFINCSSSSSMTHFINMANKTHSSEYNDISLIFSGDARIYFNSGVFIIKNNKWSNKLLDDMIYVTQNAHLYDWPNIKMKTQRDQNQFNALLQGWDVNDTEFNHIQTKVYKMWVPRGKPEKIDYSNCIHDPYIKKHAIPIDRYAFNAIPRWWETATTQQKLNMFIIHFRAEKAKSNLPWFFEIIRHSMDTCKPD